MSGKYFLVTAIHTKKKILVQYLVDGSLEDAHSLMFDICIRVFKERLRYISCSITEITNSEIKWYFWGDEDIPCRFH